MSPGVARPVYDRWWDVDGVHVPDLCQVEQVAADKLHGALRSRLRKHGQVVGRGNNRLYVRFDGEDQAASVRPHLLRVLKQGDGDDR